MPHAAEAAICGLDAAPHNAKLAIPHLFAEQIVFGIERVFIEAAQAIKGSFLKQHEHAGAERLDQERSVLRDVAEKVKRAVAGCTLRAPDVGGNAMQPAALRQFNRPAQQRGIFQFHISINKQHIRRGSAARTSVASD